MKNALISIAAVLALSSTAFAADNYKLTVTPPTTVLKGQPAVALVHVEGANGFVINLDYPVSLNITAPAGVTLVKATQTKPDAKKFAQTGLDFEIKFTSADVGTKAFTGQFKFAVSTTKDIAPATAPVSFSAVVK
jgi:hypothetical protein